MAHPTRTPEQIQGAVNRLDSLGQIQREYLVEIGQLGFGARWQAPLAAALSEAAGRTISVQSVNNWYIAHGPVPAVMYPIIADVGRQVTADLRRRAERLAVTWDPPPRVERPYTQEDLDDLAAMQLCEEMIAARQAKED